jgi:ABC-2 type transport system permease protein
MTELVLPAASVRRPSLIGDSAVMIGRSARLSRRNIEALTTALMLPIILMLMFVYIFGGAINTGSRYVTYIVPGVILLCTGYGSSQTALGVASDMTNGIIDRFRSMDVAGASVITGQVVASAIRNLASTAIVFGVAFLIGFRPTANVTGWLAAIGVLLAFIFAFSWLSAAIGLLAKSPEAAGGFTFLVMFLPYPSSALVPVHTMPGWLRGFAQHQPITPITETVRDLLLNRPVGDYAWISLAWCAGILTVSIFLATFLFRRRIA